MDYTEKYKTPKRIENYLKQGKCPVCTMLLSSKYHTDCPYLTEINEIVDKKEEPHA